MGNILLVEIVDTFGHLSDDLRSIFLGHSLALLHESIEGSMWHIL